MPYKLVVLGSRGVGKSALTIRFLQNRFMAEYEPSTRDMDHGVKVDGESCELDVLDTSGDEDCTELMEECIRWGEGFLFVFAVNSKTFMDVGIFRDRIHRVKATNWVPMVMVANKIDADNCLVEPVMDRERGQSFRMPFMETSAKTRQDVERAFHVLIQEIREKRTQDELQGPEDELKGGTHC